MFLAPIPTTALLCSTLAACAGSSPPPTRPGAGVQALPPTPDGRTCFRTEWYCAQWRAKGDCLYQQPRQVAVPCR